MVDYQQLREIVHFGMGKEAEVLGPPFSVYRLGSTASGDFLSDANRIYQNLPVFYQPNTPKVKRSIEAEKIPGVILYELSMDITQYQLKVGDVFLLTDPFQVGANQVTYETNQINAFVFAQDQAGAVATGVRLNQIATVKRPSNSVDPTRGAWIPTDDESGVLSLTGGKFAIATDDSAAANIPIGVFPVSRPYGDKAFDQAPSEPRKNGWSGFVPPLKGFNFRQGDKVITADGSIYQVIIGAPQETGLVGTYLFLEREIDGTLTPSSD